MKKILSLIIVGSVLLLSSLASRATTITFDAVDLTDVGSGDLWQYSYTVTNNGPANPLQAFRIFFALGSYENLALGFAPTDWDPIVVQPGTFVGLNDGYYDVLSVDPAVPFGPGLALGESAGLFSVQFDWIGNGTPGSQAFSIYNPATFAELDTGFTVPSPIPLPAAVWLFGSGIAGLMIFARRKVGSR